MKKIELMLELIFNKMCPKSKVWSLVTIIIEVQKDKVYMKGSKCFKFYKFRLG